MEIINDLPFVDNFEILPLQKRAHFGLSSQNIGNELACNFLLTLVWLRHEPFLKPTFALPAKQEHKLNLKRIYQGSHCKILKCNDCDIARN